MIESPTITACRKSIRAARERPDCDMPPRLISVNRAPLTDDTYVVEVDLQYSTEGWEALYGYRERDGDLALYQD